MGGNILEGTFVPINYSNNLILNSGGRSFVLICESINILEGMRARAQSNFFFNVLWDLLGGKMTGRGFFTILQFVIKFLYFFYFFQILLPGDTMKRIHMPQIVRGISGFIYVSGGEMITSERKVMS